VQCTKSLSPFAKSLVRGFLHNKKAGFGPLPFVTETNAAVPVHSWSPRRQSAQMQAYVWGNLSNYLKGRSSPSLAACAYMPMEGVESKAFRRKLASAGFFVGVATGW
jgi:hypothetical protein